MSDDKIEVLDHGYVQLIGTWGSEEEIISAARMSTGKGFQGWGPDLKCKTCGHIWKNCQNDGNWTLDFGGKSCPTCEPARMQAGEIFEPVAGDEKLLRYLYEHQHMTPFEMAGMTIEVQAPIFVIREWERHRTQGYNEMSARYSPLPDVNYVPSIERLMLNAKDGNKQAGTVKDAKALTETEADYFRALLEEQYRGAEALYQRSLKNGVPKELARVHLPVGRYSRMRATANLRNWLAFLTLRCAPAAQWEIRMYANVVSELVRQAFPRTHALWAETK